LQTEWYDKIAERITTAGTALDNKAAKGFRTDMLTRVTAKVDEFSAAACSECGSLRASIEQLVSNLEQAARGGTVDRRQYNLRLRRIIDHLRSRHGLAEAGSYLSQWIALGLCLGMVFYNLLGPAYIGIGLCLGVSIGTALDADAKKKGKQI